MWYLFYFITIILFFQANLKPFIGKDKAVDIFPLVTLETLDTILKCAFSYNGNIQTEGYAYVTK